MNNKELKTIEEKMRKAIDTQFKKRVYEEKVRCPSLSKMAQFINAKFPNLTATVSMGYSYTKDRKMGRLRSPGIRDYQGNELEVKDKEGAIIYTHDSTETYRSNIDVAEFIFKLKRSD